jgi:hypothetical protein
MSARQTDTSVLEDPLGQLERAFIEEFVRREGHDPLMLHDLPEPQRRALLKGPASSAADREVLRERMRAR